MNYFLRRSIFAAIFTLLTYTIALGQFRDIEGIAASVSEERQKNLLSFFADDVMSHPEPLVHCDQK